MLDAVLSNRHLKDLNPILYGEERCSPGHSYGPASRSYFLIHFVISGCGKYTRRGKTYDVHAGEAFIIVPDEMTFYCADSNNPWHYAWIGFDGLLAQRFAALPPVVGYRTNWAGEICMLDRSSAMIEYNVAAKLFLLYCEWFDEKKPKNDYINTVTDYINAKFTRHITVEGIADMLSLDRRYLSRIFKQKTGKTIQEYLIEVRIEKAKQLLKEGYSITESAQMCGYEDICNFSKMFKKVTGTSPGKWKLCSTNHNEGF